MKKLLLDQHGLMVLDAPEKDKVKHEYGASRSWEYEKALTEAKKGAVYLRKGQLYTIDDLGDDLKEGILYDIPEGYEVEILKEDGFGNRCYFEGYCTCKKYAILKPVTKVGNDGFMFDANSTYPKKQLTPNGIPDDAHSLEVFAIKNGEAFIGFKVSNGSFHFIQVPYTAPKPPQV